MRRFMTSEMNLEKEDMYEIDGPLDMTVFFSFCGIKGYDHLRYPEAHPHHPWSMIQLEKRRKDQYIRHDPPERPHGPSAV